MKTSRTTLLLAPVALAVALALSACGEDKAKPAGNPNAVASQPASTAVATTSVLVQPLTFVRAVTLDGEIENLYSPDVSAEVAGRLLTVSVEPGDAVRQGQVLARIDPTDAQLAAAADQAELARLQALAADKAATAKRLVPLAAQDLVSVAAMTTARQDAAAAAAAAQAAQAKSELSLRTVEKAQVRAPFDGVVSDRTAAPGAYVRAGDVLVTVVRPEASRVRAVVPESYAAQVRPGLEAGVTLADGQKLSASVEAVRPVASAGTRSVLVRLALSGEPTVRPGASARVDLVLGSEEDLAVPETAIATEGTDTFVYRIAGGRAAKTKVVTGLRSEGMVQVRSGLTAGDQVAADASFMFDGATIKGAAR